MYFHSASVELLNSAYPDLPVKFRHALTDHPLLEIENLIQLGMQLPENQLEYNPGDLSINQDTPSDTAHNNLSVEEILRQLVSKNSWLALRNIEVNSAYNNLMMDLLKEVEPVIEPISGKMYRPEGFIFVSSPNAITPFHFDPEHNILLQVKGQKIMSVFPADDPQIVSPQQHEAYHNGGHCNLKFDSESMASKGVEVELNPGDALYVPVKAPHWVQNGSEVSISLSITWRSFLSDRERRLHVVNRHLRNAGFSPRPAAATPMRNRLKQMAAKVIEAVGIR